MKEEQRVEKIKGQLLAVAPVLPDSRSDQCNVCGNAGCKCKNPQNPPRHGPYYQLSFSVKGRSSTLFLRPEEVPEARRRIRNYQRFKQLVMALTQAYVDLARKQKQSGRLSA